MHFPLASVSLAAALTAGVLLSTPLVSSSTTSASPGGSEPLASEPTIDPVSSDYEVPILRTGITPERLAAAGVASQSVGVVIAAVAEDFGDLSALEAADSAFTAARQTHIELKRLVDSGLASDEDETACQTAQTVLAAATATLDQVLAGAYTAGTAELTTPQATTIGAIRANRDWRLPTHFLVLNLEAADWVRLRNALGDEKAAPKLGLEPNSELQSFLSDKRSDEDVAAAKTSLDSNLGSIQSAWDASFAE